MKAFIQIIISILGLMLLNSVCKAQTIDSTISKIDNKVIIPVQYYNIIAVEYNRSKDELKIASEYIKSLEKENEILRTHIQTQDTLIHTNRGIIVTQDSMIQEKNVIIYELNKKVESFKPQTKYYYFGAGFLLGFGVKLVIKPF